MLSKKTIELALQAFDYIKNNDPKITPKGEGLIADAICELEAELDRNEGEQNEVGN